MLYCQCSRRQREGRPSWGSSNAPKARIYGMLEDLAGCTEGVEKQESMADDLAEEKKGGRCMKRG